MVMVGRKREYLTVERRTDSLTDNYGDIKEEFWTTYAQEWGSIKTVRGRELFGQARTESQVTHRCFLRFNDTTANIGTDDRVVWRNNVFDIASVVDIDGRKREIELMLIGRDIPLAGASGFTPTQFGAGFGEGFA